MSVRGFAADFVFTGVEGEDLLSPGAVVLDGAGRVLAVGAAQALREQYPQASWVEAPGLLMPGLVNAHVHLELSGLRGHTRSGAGFGPWAASMMAARGRLRPEQDGEAIDAAIGALLRSGTAAVGEVTNSLASVEPLSSAPLLGRVFHEVYGVSRTAAQAALEAAQQTRARLSTWPEQLSYALAPHTLFSLHPDVVTQLTRAARTEGGLTTLHLAEHAAERAYLRDGSGPFAEFLRSRNVASAGESPPGLDPVRYAAKLDALGPTCLAVHLADARADEIPIVAEAGAKVVLCPRSNLFIELKLPPLNWLLKAGLAPALGSDSLASNTTLDVLAEAAALRDRFPQIPGLSFLRMATSYGASALGLSHRVGCLRPGLAPGLLQLPCPPSATEPALHVLRYCQQPRTVLARPALPDARHLLGDAP